MQNVIIAGATGVIGQRVLTELLADPAVLSVHAVVRRPLTVQHEKLVVHICDFAHLSAWQSDIAVDTAFSCLGTTIGVAGSQAAFRAVDEDAVLAFAALAQRLGAKHFLAVSAIGASAQSRNFYSRVKGEVEDALRGLHFARLTLARPSLLTGPREEFRLGERIGQWMSAPLGPLLRGSLRAYRPIASRDVATALVRAAQQNPESCRQAVSVLTWEEMMSLCKQ